MDCREFQRFVHVFLDGEFDERDRGEVEGHLRECRSCRRQAEFEQWFRDGLRSSYEHEKPPEHLRARITSELEQLPAPRARRSWPLRMLPIAAMLVAGVFGAFLWSRADFAPFGPTPVPEAPLATRPLPPARPVPLVPAPRRAAVAAKAVEPARPPRAVPVREQAAPKRRAAPMRIAAAERNLPLEIASSDTDKVRAFLRSRLSRSIDVPTFGGRVRLVGGSADEEDATAQLVYRYGRRHLTLQVRAYDDPQLPAKGIVVRQDGPHQVALWKRNGMTFSMTSLLDPVEMVGLVADELGVGRRRRNRALVSLPPAVQRLRRFLSRPRPRFKRNFSAVPVSQER